MSAEGARILVIEDEQPIRRFLRASLASQGYRLVESETGKGGVLEAAGQPPDLVILDLGLPDIDGMEVLRQIREWSHVPIIVLSARGQEADKVHALDAGADDYLTKPFGVHELLARIRVNLRHSQNVQGDPGEATFTLGDLKVDFAHRRVFTAGREVRLTPTEYRLLSVMIRHAGKVLTHRQLLKEVWGRDSVHETHYVRVFVGQLRQKIETDPARPRYLLTEPGVGYRLAGE